MILNDIRLKDTSDWKTLLDLIYPIGSIYQTVNTETPSNKFGGTWVKIEGRFLIGQNSSYANESTGGATDITLTTNQIPSHNHTSAAHTHGLNGHVHSVGAHSHGLNSHTHGAGSYSAASNGAHSHTVTQVYGMDLGHAGWASSYVSEGLYNTSNQTVSTNGAHTHTVSGTSGTASGSTANSSAFNSGGNSGNTASTTPGNTGSSGGGASHSNMPPYYTVFIYKRTA